MDEVAAKEYDETNFVMGYLDIVPAIIFVVDNDVQLLNCNRTTGEAFGLKKDAVLYKRSGEVLNCIHSHDVPEGCGRGPFCKDCVIRNSVNAAFKNQRTTRKYARLTLIGDDRQKNLDCMITAAPIMYEDTLRAMLIIEDISEIAQLRKLIPICAWCKRIRNDSAYYESIEKYLSTHMEVDFTHGICPDCATQMNAQIAK